MGPARLPSVALGTLVMKPQVGGAEFMTGPQAGTLPGKGTGGADPLRVEPPAEPPPSVLGRDPAPAGRRWLASGVQSKGHGSRVQAARGHCVPSSQPPVTGDLRGGVLAAHIQCLRSGQEGRQNPLRVPLTGRTSAPPRAWPRPARHPRPRSPRPQPAPFPPRATNVTFIYTPDDSITAALLRFIRHKA